MFKFNTEITKRELDRIGSEVYTDLTVLNVSCLGGKRKHVSAREQTLAQHLSAHLRVVLHLSFYHSSSSATSPPPSASFFLFSSYYSCLIRTRG